MLSLSKESAHIRPQECTFGTSVYWRKGKKGGYSRSMESIPAVLMHPTPRGSKYYILYLDEDGQAREQHVKHDYLMYRDDDAEIDRVWTSRQMEDD